MTLDTYREPNTATLLQAYQEIGMASVADVNGASQLGTSTVGAVSWVRVHASCIVPSIPRASRSSS